MRTGAQLYTVRACTQNEKDFAFTIKKIADMGYKTVQISAIGRDIKPERVREICEKEGLEIVLTHSDPNRILYDTDRLIEEHNIMGCQYIGLGAMPDKYRTKEWITHFMDDFREPAKKIAAAGKLLMYRIPCVHLKDMTVDGFAQQMAPVMEGNLNFPAILKTLENTSCKYILVEQDTCQGSPFDCLKTSYDNLAAAGYR